MVAEEKVNMVGVHTQEAHDGHITIFVTLETAGVEQLARLLTKLEGIRGVVSVSRRVEGAARKRA
jgi:GTP pyrophosphokinase